jgi:hypothetical protein
LRSRQRVGRLHRDEREHLEQVALDHVAQRARLLVVAPAPIDAVGFGDRDLDVVHHIAGPGPLDIEFANRSCPIGFSTTIRARSPRPAAPIRRTMVGKAEGGVAQ